VSGWHWGEINEGPPPEPFETANLIPASLSEVQGITTTASYTYVADPACGPKRNNIICRYDVAYDVWFHDHHPMGGDAPAFELMVWLDYSWDDLWIGYTPIATVQIPAVTGPSWKIFRTASTNAVYVPATKGQAVNGVTLDLVDFIKDAITRNLISTSWWLSSVEFGIEVYQGKGTFTVTDYALAIEKKPEPEP
jgi:hypothetical protein